MFAFSHKAVIMPIAVTLSVIVPNPWLVALSESTTYPVRVSVSVPSLMPPSASARLTSVAARSAPSWMSVGAVGVAVTVRVVPSASVITSPSVRLALNLNVCVLICFLISMLVDVSSALANV